MELSANQNVWVGGVFVGPGELSAIQADFGVEEWLCSGCSSSRPSSTRTGSRRSRCTTR